MCGRGAAGNRAGARTLAATVATAVGLGTTVSVASPPESPEEKRGAGELRVGVDGGALSSRIRDCHDNAAHAVNATMGTHFALGGAVRPGLTLAPALFTLHTIAPPSREVGFSDYELRHVVLAGLGAESNVRGRAGLHGGGAAGFGWNGWSSTEGKEGRGGIGLAVSVGYDLCSGGQWCGGPVLRVLATYALTNPGCSVATLAGGESDVYVRPQATTISITLGSSFRYHGWR